MVAPAILTAIETVKSLGPAAQGSLFTYRYVGTSRWWKKHIPDGMMVTVPWALILILMLIGGIALVILFWNEINKWLDQFGSKGSGSQVSDWLSLLGGPVSLGVNELGKGMIWW